MTSKKRSPWAWIPTLYFAQGLPYVAVMTISVIMYKRLGMSNTDIALYTGWLGLPWVIKPFWSPIVDLIRTKRWWILSMQWIVAIGLAAIAFTIPTSLYVQLTLAVFMLIGFASATHDIAADGFYLLALDTHQQSFYVGIRSTFYRIATVVGQGLLVVLAGVLEMNTGLEPVEMQMVVDPDLPASIASVQECGSTSAANSQQQPRFSFAVEKAYPVNAASAVRINGVEIPAGKVLNHVDSLNAEAGFATIESAGPAGKAQEWSSFRSWLKEKFGEQQSEVSRKDANIAVVAISLQGMRETDEERILNLNFKEGDQSIKLVKGARLVFNKDNRGKTAYVAFSIDPKIKSRTTAVFIGTSGNIPMAWSIVFGVLSLFFLIVVIYHQWALPRPADDRRNISGNRSAVGDIMTGFGQAFKTFFTKYPLWQTVGAIAFMLLYRFPEAQLTKILQPFLLDPVDAGGLGLTTGEVGLVYGTVGIIGLTLGGIIGGIAAARGGLKKWLMPMAWSMSLTCLSFIYLSYVQDHSLLTVNICVFIEQFGYGFGFTAYMLYLIYYSEGNFKTSHYAICTGFMALSMMTGMVAGWIQETIGYRHFFVWTMVCCIITIAVVALVKVDPQFGRKQE